MPSTNLKNKHFLPEEKLRILQLQTKDRKIRDICRESSTSEGSFYAWRFAYQTNGIDGLKRKQRNGLNHPQKISPKIVLWFIEFSIANPEMGCCSIASELKRRGYDVSSPSVQKHLLKAQLGKRSQRIYELEKRHFTDGLEINSKQKALINKNNPYFKHRGEIGTYPGEVLVQDTFQIFSFLPQTEINVVIDTYSCYVFAQPSQTNTPAMAVEFLSISALSFFKRNNSVVRKIITGKAKAFTNSSKSYRKYLDSQNITHEIFNAVRKRHHGYVEKFKKDLLLQLASIRSEPNDISTLTDFVNRICDESNEDKNLAQYFPTFGNSPISIVKHHVQQKGD